MGREIKKQGGSKPRLRKEGATRPAKSNWNVPFHEPQREQITWHAT